MKPSSFGLVRSLVFSLLVQGALSASAFGDAAVTAEGPNTLASASVSQDEFTSAQQSSPSVSLPTSDSVHFSVPTPQTGFISFAATVQNAGGSGGDCYDDLFIDGVEYFKNSASSNPGENKEHALTYVFDFGVGAHTVLIKHATNNNITCHWRNRSLSVSAGTGPMTLFPYVVARQFIRGTDLVSAPQAAPVALPQESLYFDLAEPANLSFHYTATVNHVAGASGGDCYDQMFLDNGPLPGDIAISGGSSTLAQNSIHNILHVIQVSSGRHTLLVKHYTNNGITCGYYNRSLAVLAAVNTSSLDIASGDIQSIQQPKYGVLSLREGFNFNLPVSSSVLFSYTANVNHSATAGGGDCFDAIYIDNIQRTTGSSSSSLAANTQHTMEYGTVLSAGPHTVDILHATNNNLTCQWSERSLLLTQVAGAEGPLTLAQLTSIGFHDPYGRPVSVQGSSSSQLIFTDSFGNQSPGSYDMAHGIVSAFNQIGIVALQTTPPQCGSGDLLLPSWTISWPNQMVWYQNFGYVSGFSSNYWAIYGIPNSRGNPYGVTSTNGWGEILIDGNGKPTLGAQIGSGTDYESSAIVTKGGYLGCFDDDDNLVFLPGTPGAVYGAGSVWPYEDASGLYALEHLSLFYPSGVPADFLPYALFQEYVPNGQVSDPTSITNIVGPAPDLRNPNFDFGSVNVNTTSRTTVYNQVSNFGQSAVYYVYPTMSPSGQLPGEGFKLDPYTCNNAMLAPGTSCQYILNFTPTQRGEHEVQVNLSYSNSAYIPPGFTSVPGGHITGLGK